jgi:hypothetical protein
MHELLCPPIPVFWTGGHHCSWSSTSNGSRPLLAAISRSPLLAPELQTEREGKVVAVQPLNISVLIQTWLGLGKDVFVDEHE